VFQEPVKAAAWTGVYDAKQFGQKCPQPSMDRLGALASFMTPSEDAVYQQSRAAALADNEEDCLTLDVYTPTVLKKYQQFIPKHTNFLAEPLI
jgi:carboxylesterase type B